MAEHDVVTEIVAWEEDEMGEQQEVAFFQSIVDSGLAWKLPGCYGRRAMQLIREGRVRLPPPKKGS